MPLHRRPLQKGPLEMHINKTSPTSPIRRSKDDLRRLLAAVLAILDGEAGRISVRHLFYRLVSTGYIEKTEKAYKLLCRHLANWRRKRFVPWDAFVDNLRWHLGRPTYDSVEAALLNAIGTYRRNTWGNADVFLELWCEKDAIAGVLNEVADPFGVRVFPCRGFASLSSLYGAAENFEAQRRAGKRCLVYFFGDHDPSGLYIDRKAQETLRDDFSVDVVFERVAVLPEQIEQFKLPTRPTKQTDSRAASFDGESVEIDAMPMAELRRLAESCITRHLPRDEWERLKMIEEQERESLAAALMNLPNGTDPFALGNILKRAAEDFGL